MPAIPLHANRKYPPEEGHDRCIYCAKPAAEQSEDEMCRGPLPLRQTLEAIRATFAPAGNVISTNAMVGEVERALKGN